MTTKKSQTVIQLNYVLEQLRSDAEDMDNSYAGVPENNSDGDISCYVEDDIEVNESIIKRNEEEILNEFLSTINGSKPYVMF